MRLRLALPLLLVVVAGCSGVAGPGDAEAETETETLTAVPVTEPPGDGRGADGTPRDLLAPGLSDDGVVDAAALAGAHSGALSNRSFTRITHTTLAGPNGTLRVTHRVLAVDTGGHRYHLVETAESAPSYPVDSVTPRFEIWYDSGPALFRVGEGENVTYRVGTTGTLNGPVGDLTRRDRLLGLYGTVDRWDVRPVIGPDATRFVLESAEPPDRDALQVPLFVESPSNAELRIVLTDRGRVVSQQLRYDAAFDGEPVRIVRRTRFVHVGETTVAQPAWRGEARSATTDETTTDETGETDGPVTTDETATT